MNRKPYPAPGVAGKSHTATEPRPPARQPYRAPRLDAGGVEDLLDVLGPAQASYGGNGFGP